jgi:hypothetical protein
MGVELAFSIEEARGMPCAGIRVFNDLMLISPACLVRFCLMTVSIETEYVSSRIMQPICPVCARQSRWMQGPESAASEAKRAALNGRECGTGCSAARKSWPGNCDYDTITSANIQEDKQKV